MELTTQNSNLRDSAAKAEKLRKLKKKKKKFALWLKDKAPAQSTNFSTHPPAQMSGCTKNGAYAARYANDALTMGGSAGNGYRHWRHEAWQLAATINKQPAAYKKESARVE